MKDSKCEMKGFLSFLMLWMVSRKPMTGAEIASELERRKGTKPSPGTIYPALKELKDKELITSDDNKSYTITKKGTKELNENINHFFGLFCDLDEMKSCCSKKK